MVGVSLEGNYGSVEGIDDFVTSILDAQSSTQVIKVAGSGGSTMTLRALTIQNGRGHVGGLYIYSNAVVVVKMCSFINCESTNSGGAILAWSTFVTINVYGSNFSGNTGAAGRECNDMHLVASGSGNCHIVHNTRPSPYSSNDPTQGKTRMKRRRIASSKEPFITLKLTSYLPIPIFPSSASQATLWTQMAMSTAQNTPSLAAYPPPTLPLTPLPLPPRQSLTTPTLAISLDQLLDGWLSSLPPWSHTLNAPRPMLHNPRTRLRQ